MAGRGDGTNLADREADPRGRKSWSFDEYGLYALAAALGKAP